MKKLTTIILLTLIVWSTTAQTGITTYTIPTAYNGAKTCLKVDAAGNKWFGTTHNGLIKFDGTNYTQYDTLTAGFPSEWVNDVAFYTSNNIFVATNKGLARYTGSTWVTYNTSNSNIPNDTVNCITIQGPYIYIGTNNGVGKFNLTTWVNYNSTNSGLNTRVVNCLAVDNVGDLYVGTNANLYRKSGSTWTTNFSGSTYYPSTLAGVRSIYVDAANTKWIGSTTGVYVYSGGLIKNITTVYPNYTNVFPFGTCYSISKGSLGGAMFLNGSNLLEVANGQVYSYSALGITSLKYLAIDNTSGLIWTENFLTNGNLYSFNHINYTLTTPLQQPTPPIKQEAFLDVNQVNAEILNRGDMFWDIFGTTAARYEVPKGSGRNSNFTAALWMGGIDNGGQLHTAAQTYRQSGNDYWPGPVDTVSGTADSVTSLAYDRLWKLDRLKINEFRTQFALGNVQSGTYAVDSNIITYPAIGTGHITRKLAPFIDVNHDGLYRPLIDGDYPDIKGDQEVYWIFNDVQGAHSLPGGLPLGVEVHATAYAFACPHITDSLDVLNYTTFYNFKIINRSTNNYHNTHLGYFDDIDLGWYKDDFIGCDSAMNYGMGYNGDNVDGPGGFNYGQKPPMMSAVVLNGPIAQPADGIDNNNNGITDEVGEKNLMTSFLYFGNTSNPNIGNPTTSSAYFNYMCGYWGDTTHITYGGAGYGGTVPTNFMFSGALDDTIPWTETTSNNTPDDRRFVIGCGPFNLDAGQSVEFDLAQVFTRDTVSTYTIGNLYQKNKADVRRVQQWFAVDSFPSCLDLYAGVNELGAGRDELGIFPNPSSGMFTITSTNKITKIELFNLLGECVLTPPPSFKEGAGGWSFNMTGFAKGIYFVKITDENKRVVNKKVVVQ